MRRGENAKSAGGLVAFFRTFALSRSVFQGIQAPFFGRVVNVPLGSGHVTNAPTWEAYQTAFLRALAILGNTHLDYAILECGRLTLAQIIILSRQQGAQKRTKTDLFRTEIPGTFEGLRLGTNNK